MQQDRTLAAAGLICTYALLIGFTDNFVQGHRRRGRAVAVPLDPHGDGDGTFGAGGGAAALALAAPAAGVGGGALGDPWRGDGDLFRRAGLSAGGFGGGRAVHRADLRAADFAAGLWPSHRRGADRGGGAWLCRRGAGAGAAGARRASLAAVLPVLAGALYAWAISRRGSGAARRVPRPCWPGSSWPWADRGCGDGGAVALAGGLRRRGLPGSCSAGRSGPRSSFTSGPLCRQRARCLRSA